MFNSPSEHQWESQNETPLSGRDRIRAFLYASGTVAAIAGASAMYLKGDLDNEAYAQAETQVTQDSRDGISQQLKMQNAQLRANLIKTHSAGPTQRSQEEVNVLQKFGGNIFNTDEIPTNANKKARGRTYIRLPENIDQGTPRVVVFLHRNGGANLDITSNENVIGAAKQMQEAGANFILIMPQDDWANKVPEEGYKKKPGNWRDFNDPNTFIGLINFAEVLAGRRVNDISLSSFSGGNIGVKKILRALRRSQGKNPEAARLYHSIQDLTGFDSFTGEGKDEMTKWMLSNPDGTVNMVYDPKAKMGIYENGVSIHRKNASIQGIKPGRFITVEAGNGHGGHGVHPDHFVQLIGR